MDFTKFFSTISNFFKVNSFYDKEKKYQKKAKKKLKKKVIKAKKISDKLRIWRKKQEDLHNQLETLTRIQDQTNELKTPDYIGAYEYDDKEALKANHEKLFNDIDYQKWEVEQRLAATSQKLNYWEKRRDIVLVDSNEILEGFISNRKKTLSSLPQELNPKLYQRVQLQDSALEQARSYEQARFTYNQDLPSTKQIGFWRSILMIYNAVKAPEKTAHKAAIESSDLNEAYIERARAKMS